MATAIPDLGSRPVINHVLTFQNKGEVVVGARTPIHTTCQIDATNFAFGTIEIENPAGHRHFEDTGRVLFQDIIAAEQQDGRRIFIRERIGHRIRPLSKEICL